MRNHNPANNLRSFARRIGKSLSIAQEKLLEKELPTFLINCKAPLYSFQNHSEICLEIGIGMAEHFINQCELNPSTVFIGCEPYLNGIANCLKLAKEKAITNFKLWPDDADLILYNFKSESFDKIFLLFPDPWLKNKQKKRRFASQARIELFYKLLKKNGVFIFASDILDYTANVFDIAINGGFIDNSLEARGPHLGYLQTKYHSKAIAANRQAQFLIMRKL